ncbi:hypothetical protein ACET3Z_021772 [Daucus carota]
MEGSDSTNQNNPTTNRGDIPDLDICFCDKLMVERTCWFDENTGRRMLACPDRWNGCPHMKWIEPPLESRAVAVVQAILKEMNNLKHRHQMEKCKIYDGFARKREKLVMMAKEHAAAIEAAATESDIEEDP